MSISAIDRDTGDVRRLCIAERAFFHGEAIDIPMPDAAFRASICSDDVVEVRDVPREGGYFATAYARC
jgi:hypothetical protein